MFRRIIVPLDTSELAEAILPYIQQLDPNQRAEIMLVSVLESNHYGYALASNDPVVATRLFSTLNETYEHYLSVIKESLNAQGYSAQAEIVRGDAAQSIVDAAEQFNADLIAMTTHGRTGIARWALGSVADRIIRTADQPVFLVRNEIEIPEKPSLKRILVPLDGSELAETAFTQAQTLAKELSGSIVTLRVLEPFSRLERELIWQQHLVVDDVEFERRTDAEEYLHKIESRMDAADIPCESKLYSGNPVSAIQQVTKEEEIDLIVMSTHGRSGYSRWVYGSVASRVLHSANCPLLLIRGIEVAKVLQTADKEGVLTTA
ncbi:universal stress protein [Chloroflexi bacterium TSY]|nr:universal stress protein [Chloroflexi bacterium TSY]